MPWRHGISANVAVPRVLVSVSQRVCWRGAPSTGSALRVQGTNIVGNYERLFLFCRRVFGDFLFVVVALVVEVSLKCVVCIVLPVA